MQPLRTAANVVQIVFLCTAVGVLSSVDSLLGRDSGPNDRPTAKSGHNPR